MGQIAIIETPRLLLRPIQAEDLEPLAILGADPEVMCYIGSGTTQSRAEAEQWFAQLLEEAQCHRQGSKDLPGWLVIVTQEKGEWLGLAALKQLADHHLEAIGVDPTVEVGYRLAKEHWGNGYATEATSALVQYGFEVLGLPQICAVADARNVASNRVIAKVGLTCRQTYVLGPRTIQFHSIIRSEFKRGATDL